ncbi:MAG: Flp pilus assembly protein CpaB [Alphaproteobacteria bacterium]|nr:Flp pilus assembly protein CpaB [Alphaproteobacteria bacterium]
MSVKTISMLSLALASALGTGYAAMDFMNNQKRQLAELQNTPAQTVVVEQKASLVALVASGDLQAGQFIRPEDLEWLAWPETAVNDRYVTLDHEDAENDALAEEAINSFKGGVVRQNILKGQPLQQGQVAFPGERGFLAAVLNPGMKAVSVSVAKEAGVSGLVFPGDRVDVVVALRLKGTDIQGTSTTRFVSTTVLEDIRVLAIDQTLAVDDDEGSLQGKTATLEVTEDQARRIAVSEAMGSVSLALRSLASEENTAISELALPGGTEKSTFSNAAVSPVGTQSKGKFAKKDYTLDTEVFSQNGYDLSLIVGSRSSASSKKEPAVVILRGNQGNKDTGFGGGKNE